MPARTKTARTMTSIARFSSPGIDSIVHHLKDDKGVVYRCTLNPNGTDGCYEFATGEECKAHQHGRQCYHTKEARRIESERTAPVQTPVPVKRPISEAPITNNEGFSLLKRTR